MTLVLGAGPAGLTAARELAARGVDPVVLEAGDSVGGLARTVERDGYRFDLGGHRFFTKCPEVEEIWEQVLGAELLDRPRLSRIHWRGRFLDYPLRAGDVVRKLGPVELGRSLASYAVASLRPAGPEDTFEQWVTRRFGRRLFELFFRSYTEKVWGVPTSELRAEWAAQRIRDLSFGRAVRAALLGDGEQVQSLIGSFRYPRLGPGQLWEAMAAEVEAGGGEVRVSCPVERIEIETGPRPRLAAVVAGGERIEAEAVISSIALREIVVLAGEAAPSSVRTAAAGLRYRDFLTVALVLPAPDPFPDNWIYIHEPSVRVGRIQNFRSWSPALVPDPRTTCLGLEYFCFEGDELWRTPDAELVALAAAELEALGLGTERPLAGYVVRVPGAYPIYDSEYAERITTVRRWLDPIENLQQVGRNGLHRYNNSDHSMLTALLAVENLLEGAEHDIWQVNTDGAYHEQTGLEEQPYRRAPRTPALQQP